jgi:hypothetical protein
VLKPNVEEKTRADANQMVEVQADVSDAVTSAGRRATRVSGSRPEQSRHSKKCLLLSRVSVVSALSSRDPDSVS